MKTQTFFSINRYNNCVFYTSKSVFLVRRHRYKISNLKMNVCFVHVWSGKKTHELCKYLHTQIVSCRGTAQLRIVSGTQKRLGITQLSEKKSLRFSNRHGDIYYVIYVKQWEGEITKRKTYILGFRDSKVDLKIVKILYLCHFKFINL